MKDADISSESSLVAHSPSEGEGENSAADVANLYTNKYVLHAALGTSTGNDMSIMSGQDDKGPDDLHKETRVEGTVTQRRVNPEASNTVVNTAVGTAVGTVADIQ